MWLVAPLIPHSVREFLDRIGIEYTEIHIAEFRRVADRHGVSVQEDVPALPLDKPIRHVAQRKRKRESFLRYASFSGPRLTCFGTGTKAGSLAINWSTMSGSKRGQPKNWTPMACSFLRNDDIGLGTGSIGSARIMSRVFTV